MDTDDMQSVAAKLQETRHYIDQLQREQLDLIAQLRAHDQPWSIVGFALGLTRQAVQQKYGPLIEPLLKTQQYHCDCGWSIAYPGWDTAAALDDIDDHRYAHERETTEYGQA